MSEIVKIFSHDNKNEIQECVEEKQIPSEDLINSLIQRGFEGEYDVNYIKIEKSELGSHEKTIVKGNGNCVVYDVSGEEREYFTYEINYGTSSSGRIYDDLEVIINI